MSNNIPGFTPPPPPRPGVFVPPTMPNNPEAGKLNITPEMKVQRDAFWGKYEKATDLKAHATASMHYAKTARLDHGGNSFENVAKVALGLVTGGIGSVVSGWAGNLASGIISSITGKKS